MASCQHSKGFKIPIAIKPKLETESQIIKDGASETEPAPPSTLLSSNPPSSSVEPSNETIIPPDQPVPPSKVETPSLASSSQPSDPTQSDTTPDNENPTSSQIADQPASLRGLGSRTSEEEKNADKKAMRYRIHFFS